MTTDPPVCPTCGMPCTEGLEERDGLWECANEACPEFGQALQDHEPPPREPPDPGRP